MMNKLLHILKDLCAFPLIMMNAILCVSCASGTIIQPIIVETCMNEQGCEPDCLEDVDCEEGQRCVEGLCYDNDCMNGETRSCEGECGLGTQQCVGGIWRGCSTTVANLEMCLEGGVMDGGAYGGEGGSAGEIGGDMMTKMGGTMGGDMAGMIEGGDSGEPGGAQVPTTCDPTWTEICTDLVDQDCDGVVDEGCGSCPLTFEMPLKNEANANSRFNTEFGYVKLGKMGLVRRAVMSRTAVSTRPLIYGLGTTNLRYSSENLIEAGSVKALFPIGTQIGLLEQTSAGLHLLTTSVTGETDQKVLVSSSSSSEESVYYNTEQLIVSWTENGNVKIRIYTPSNISPQGAAIQISNHAFRSGMSSVTQTSQMLTVAYEDERNQVTHPEIMITGVNASNQIVSEVVFTQGYEPRLLWSGGRLYLLFKQLDQDLYKLYLTQIDPETLQSLQEPTLLYSGAHELAIASFFRSADNELALILKVSVNQDLHQMNLLYLTELGRVRRGPYLIQEFARKQSLASSDVYYDLDQGGLITGWMESGYEDSLSYQFMQVRMTTLESIPDCATAP